MPYTKKQKRTAAFALAVKHGEAHAKKGSVMDMARSMTDAQLTEMIHSATRRNKHGR